MSCAPVQRALNWRGGEETNDNDNREDPAAATLDADLRKSGSASRDAMLAVMVQVAGLVADETCECCRAGGGEWVECIIPPPGHGHKTAWTCANCFRGKRIESCSLFLKTDQLDRVKKQCELSTSR